MPESVVTQAIVLRTVNFGESDRIVTLYGRSTGKVSAVARGARRSKKRFGAALGIFGIGEAVLKSRPRASSDLMWLESFTTTGSGFHELTTDVAKVAHAGYLCELVNELTPVHEVEPAV